MFKWRFGYNIGLAKIDRNGEYDFTMNYPANTYVDM